ncbi:SDR family NAD(P)-dependent oxidoreductase [Clostridium fermenticellae]|uniref:SDR family NAD(P)-dependent oxidoreductase n=1 Tax=Clostridium fermenticellae TaxID=2068654 RepID=A0A386H373_9CLOT|nr:SDR family NAD(P)-dependent oxidoreductase [Clostridium fermenticellae]AYD40104.1 SDR family NAD(P)-dependent oxidoreductase [Clostridium fermenticellae]
MKAAIVTGASSGIGFEISKRLLNIGYKVYGFGRDFSRVDSEMDNFIRICCDLRETHKLIDNIKSIKKEEEIYILVNSAGIGYFGPHEELNPYKIKEMVEVNLEVPMILTNLLLRDLKKNRGYIINISSITAKKWSTYGCAYAASKAGITHFSESLFEESRKYGVKIVTIHPDIVKTHFYDKCNFREGDADDSYIMPECIGDAVQNILSQKEGIIVTDMTIRPQRHMITRKK